MVALAVAATLGRDRRAWRLAASQLAIAAVSLLLVLGPLIDYGLRDPVGYSRRLDQTSVFNHDAIAGHAPLRRIEQNTRLILGMWNERGDPNARRVLGPGAHVVGQGPRSPIDGRPEFVVYGCDPTLRPFVARALDSDNTFGMTMLEQ